MFAVRYAPLESESEPEQPTLERSLQLVVSPDIPPLGIIAITLPPV